MKNTNVKNLRVVALLLLCTMLALSSCSAVFDSAISGKVIDANTEQGISGVRVFAYSSSSERAAAIDRYNSKTNKAEFVDTSAFYTSTDTTGNFSISNLRWKTNSPFYGKDADKIEVYFLFFSKEYGLNSKYSEAYTVQSEKSNYGNEFKLESVMKSKNLTINFKDSTSTGTTASNITSTSDFSYTYSYNDGYETRTIKNNSVTNGTAVISISYLSSLTTAPTVTISDIETGSDWNYNGTSQTVEVDMSKTNSVTISCDNVWSTKTISFNFVDGSLPSLPNVDKQMELTYSYDDNDSSSLKTDKVTITNGVGSFTVRYKNKKDANEKAVIPTVTISNIHETGNKTYWTRTKGETDGTPDTEDIKIDSITEDKDTYTIDVYFKKSILVFPGMSGWLLSTAPTSTDKVKGTTVDNGRTLYIYNGDKFLGVTSTDKEKPQTSDQTLLDNGVFEGLGTGAEIALTYTDATSYTSDSVTLNFKYKKGNTTPTAINNYTLSVNSATESGELTNIEIIIG